MRKYAKLISLMVIGCIIFIGGFFIYSVFGVIISFLGAMLGLIPLFLIGLKLSKEKQLISSLLIFISIFFSTFVIIIFYLLFIFIMNRKGITWF